MARRRRSELIVALDVPTTAAAVRLARRLRDELAGLPGVLAGLEAMALPKMVIHGDFFPGNLSWNEGRVAGLIDWDESTVDWRAREIADAAIEFSRGDGSLHANPGLVREFIASYVAAGGALLDREREAMRRLRKLRLLWETLYELGRATEGAELDYEYLWANLTSLDGADESLFMEE